MHLIEIQGAYFLKILKKSLAFYIFMCYNTTMLKITTNTKQGGKNYDTYNIDTGKIKQMGR